MDINLEHIEFSRDEVPVSKKVDIEGALYTIEICYNDLYDFYTAAVYDDAEQMIVSSKLVNMGDVFAVKKEGIPAKKLVPLDINDLTTSAPENIKVDYTTFSERIKLYLI